jgi:hypothetical protein
MESSFWNVNPFKIKAVSIIKLQGRDGLEQKIQNPVQSAKSP